MGFIGGERPEDFRLVTRAHVIDCVMTSSAGLSPATICRKLSALSSLYQYLREKTAVPLNPIEEVQKMRHE
jgi:site-specific recombinase XerC